MKIAKEFLVVVANTVTIFLRQSSPPPPALLRHGLYSYSASPYHPSSLMDFSVKTFHRNDRILGNRHN
ncbi:hypothetical protein ARALYDRAFT_899813 [Arabidopsis lyrata subsp. lyrata]|uniref:Uncharacterized protein n=1 Tax=Arabidopsis lyrata subsp. lyrata TaxID=81972 RepID=D7L4H1_ARALL|nr:hypothetical protein ARALYDRAFT_899813 [Arabidopsis lyrata subsp. lyrata]